MLEVKPQVRLEKLKTLNRAIGKRLVMNWLSLHIGSLYVTFLMLALETTRLLIKICLSYRCKQHISLNED